MTFYAPILPLKGEGQDSIDAGSTAPMQNNFPYSESDETRAWLMKSGKFKSSTAHHLALNTTV
jgi:hypothetical protein